METSDPAAEFIPAGLASLGIEADEVDMAVMSAAHQMFWPGILGLVTMDLGDVKPERSPDLSKAPAQA